MMDLFWSPGGCAACTLMTLVAVLFDAEFRRYKVAALPYFVFYWIAATFYAMFLVFALEVPSFSGKLGRSTVYLTFTTVMLIIGLVLHRLSVTKRSGMSQVRSEGA